MNKILIITGNMCDDSELLYPYYRLLEEGYQVDIATVDGADVHAKYHFSLESDLPVSAIAADEYDGLLLPGGLAPEKLRQNIDVIAAVRKINDAGKPIASICHGQQILISAKVLNGIDATCYPGIKDDLINTGAIYHDEPVVVSKNLVTSRRPQDLPYFMKEYIKILKD